MIKFNDFSKIDIRVGKITKVELLKNAKYTTHKITIDFGEMIGIKYSCARLINYTIEDFVGK